MSDVMEKLVRGLSPEKRVSLAKMLLRSAGEAVPEQKLAEPIAIIGIGCRFPGGVNGPEAFWKLLREGVDAVKQVPGSRWDIDKYYDADPAAPGKMYTRNGAFLEDADQFDSYFFGIPPRAAANLDPQHRLLLEVSWEALEHAGIAPQSIAGSKTGIFIGGSTGEYTQLVQAAKGADNIDATFLTGSLLTFATGRLSHFFDLQGPSLAVDTACSSSLVAVHLACQSLRTGESSMALVGGVNLILAPQGTITTCKARMLAVDGRCKTFDAEADGYGRGEGCGIIVLKRLSDAQKDGDNILAVIRGTATNQDGHSSDLTVPNGLAQQAVIRQALENAGLEPGQVDYVEAHGTGTALGDPIELRAIGAVFGKKQDREQPLLVGSVKTNFGHLEYASGIAGLIKLALSMSHGEIPPHLHFKRGNPYIPWNELPVEIPTKLTPWKAKKDKRIGSVSSFGASGTNAHVVLEEAPKEGRQTADRERPAHVLSLSARSEVALKALAGRYAQYLASSGAVNLADVCHTANAGRAQFKHRLALVAESAAQLSQQLGLFAEGKPAEVLLGQAPNAGKAEVVFLFTGQGSQHEGMGRELYETQPVYRESLKKSDELLRPVLNESLLEVLYGGKGHLLEQSGVSQPALFAVEYALAQLWKSWGVKPAAVMGHSLGEYVAACVAGMCTQEEGLKVVAARGRLMEQLPEAGEMVAVLAAEAKVQEAVAPYAQSVSVAAVNGPEETVVSGRAAQVEQVVSKLKEQGVDCRKLKTTHAFHSPLMEPMLEEFEKEAGKVKWKRPEIEVVSNVSGQLAKGEEGQKGEYWKKHIRQPVKYWEGLKGLYEKGYRVFVEVGPKPTLVNVGKRNLPGGEAEWVGSLKQGSNEWQQMLGSVAKLYVKGVGVDWAGFDQDYPRAKVALPTYPFQRERYWIDSLIPNSDVLVSFYRAVAQMLDVTTVQEGPSLRFATLREAVPGFSWISLYKAEPENMAGFQKYYDLAVQANREMSQTIFRGLNFPAFSRVLDIGCGHSADLIDLAMKHSHLELHGCNISPDQIAVGRQRIRGLGLDERITLHYQDSSRDPFPSTYDLVLGFQVIHHIRNKADLFANISRSMRNGGYLVMAETLSNMVTPIEHPESTTLFVPQAEWVELLARNQLRVVQAVEATQEIANFLYDPQFNENFERVTRDSDDVTKKHLHGIHMLGELLQRRLAAYLLFTVTKDESMDVDTLRRINAERLSVRLPYATAFRQVQEGTFVLPTSVEDAGAQGATSAASAFANALSSAEPSQRGQLLGSYLCEQVAHLLKMPVAKLDPEQPLNSMGMDSLLSLELKHKIHAETGMDVPLDEVLQGASIANLSMRLAERMGNSGQAAVVAKDWEEGEL
ncbi:type I polyketide synthase [Stigmatella aurantiaca]|nr:type I polyketide synthase [Stigmatella aurantiaca]EAU62732.1 cyclopropane-fatty-acyl-phospholipid synthase family [Stigmatella aurantiaca DW4/3-1]